MIQINGHWETINTPYDIARIIRENYDRELANLLVEMIQSEEEWQKEQDSLYNTIDSQENEIMDLEFEIDSLKNEIEKLKDRIRELES